MFPYLLFSYYFIYYNSSCIARLVLELCARFVTSQAKLTVILVYAPTNDTCDQTKYGFYRVMSNVVAKAHRHDIVTVCGDFNAKVGSDASYAVAILGKTGGNQ